ncbi:hypothetical protein KM043_018627 [Ampulex compressa]|nr:hypothetical protein KM043_018627 [Ampulex compressa]
MSQISNRATTIAAALAIVLLVILLVILWTGVRTVSDIEGVGAPRGRNTTEASRQIFDEDAETEREDGIPGEGRARTAGSAWTPRMEENLTNEGKIARYAIRCSAHRYWGFFWKLAALCVAGGRLFELGNRDLDMRD